MKTLIKKSLFVLKHEGLIALIKKVYVYVSFKIQTRHARYENMFKDVLFINGCPIDYCERYRVEHKMEELKAYGLSCDLIEAHEIDERKIKVGEVFDGYINDDEEGVTGYDDQLDIRPKYQREFVYNHEQQCEVIRTVLKGLPLNRQICFLAPSMTAVHSVCRDRRSAQIRMDKQQSESHRSLSVWSSVIPPYKYFFLYIQ